MSSLAGMSNSKKIRLSPKESRTDVIDYEFNVRSNCPNLWALSEFHQFPYIKYILCRDGLLGEYHFIARRINRYVYATLLKARFLETRLKRLEFATLHDVNLGRAPDLIKSPSFKLPWQWTLMVEQTLQHRGDVGEVWSCARCTFVNTGEKWYGPRGRGILYPSHLGDHEDDRYCGACGLASIRSLYGRVFPERPRIASLYSNPS